MRKLIMLQGLPGSGKSTWAGEQADGSWRDAFLDPVFVVNKDQIRAELGAEWSRDVEKEVVRRRDACILEYFRMYKDVTVISDDTNFARKHKTRLRELATISGAQFEVKRFDLPLEECVKRARARITQPQVPEEAIRKMALQFGVGGPLEYPAAAPVPTLNDQGYPLPYAIICDLDGTLSLLNGRNPYDASTCDQDLINYPVRTLLEVYYRTQEDRIIYLSGREDTYRPQTETFMRAHHCPPGDLWMRPAGDHRKDWMVKGELFDAHVRGRYRVRFVLDDRNQVVDYWRHLGLTCFQVARGDF